MSRRQHAKLAVENIGAAPSTRATEANAALKALARALGRAAARELTRSASDVLPSDDGEASC